MNEKIRKIFHDVTPKIGMMFMILSLIKARAGENQEMQSLIKDLEAQALELRNGLNDLKIQISALSEKS